MDTFAIIAAVAGGAFATAFYGFFFSILFQRRRVRSYEQRFFRALRESLTRGDSEQQTIETINLVYRGLAEEHSLGESVKGPIDLVERFVRLHETETDDVFNLRCGFEKDPTIRNRAHQLLMALKSDNPFYNLPTKAANLMRNLYDAVQSGNQALAETSLSQLSEEIRLADREFLKQDRASRTAFFVAALGVVLTAFFGATSVGLVIAS